MPVINLPFIALGYKQVGAQFALKSALAIAGSRLCLAFVHFPDVTPDKLLTAVFGGFFIGAGIGLAMRGGAVLDGTEVAALLMSKRSSLLRVGDVILILNIFIFLGGGLLPRRRVRALLDPHLRRRVEDRRLPAPRHRGVHRGRHRLRAERGDPAGDHPRPRRAA